MKITVAIVGRPNVGKSTLFNRLTKSRAALVADYPGLTRDRHYGEAHVAGRSFFVVDTGGFEPKAESGILKAMAKQTLQAIDEADAVIFLTDGREGLNAHDHDIARLLRKKGRHVSLAVNKAEGMQRERVAAEFHELGLGVPMVISSAHGDGVSSLIEEVLAPFPDGDAAVDDDDANDEATSNDEAPVEPVIQAPVMPERIRIAIVGRPNVGKSTLVNALLGEERVIAFDEPGTTRDAIYLDFERDGRQYTIIDTAGVRRRGKVTEAIEKFSVIKTMQAINDAHVVVLLLDALQGVSEQDGQVAGFILESGRALVVAINKWEATTAEQRDNANNDYERKLYFLNFAEKLQISAKSGTGLKGLMTSVRKAVMAAHVKLPTPRLTRILQLALQQQQPPRAGVVRPKMRYAHQGGHNPPVVVIHGNALDKVSDTYRRYLEHFYRDAFKLKGTPLRIDFKLSRNPFAENSSTYRK